MSASVAAVKPTLAQAMHDDPGAIVEQVAKDYDVSPREVRCDGLAFVERPFMGRPSASLLFFNTEGGIMLKVFVGRDEKRDLKADQLTAFRALADRLCGTG